MLNFNKNELINETLDKYFETFSHTLDTADFVPEKFNKKIHKYIFKNMKKSFRKIDKEDRVFQRKLRLEEKKKNKKKRHSLIYRLVCSIRYNRLKRKHRLLTYNNNSCHEVSKSDTPIY